MERIGLPDTPANREFVARHFGDVLDDQSNILRIEADGRVVRESLFVGQRGAVKIVSWWDGDRLITFIVTGKGSRFRHLEN
ncbi:MAG TPA: hypothetical protein EYP04_09115 [Anaerolineae bacterium]|nr:hypothetical protein [Anaerolineae bacterium]